MGSSRIFAEKYERSEQTVQTIQLMSHNICLAFRKRSTLYTVCIKYRSFYKTKNGYNKNSVEPDRTPQNVASDQGLHSTLFALNTGVSIKQKMVIIKIYQKPLILEMGRSEE